MNKTVRNLPENQKVTLCEDGKYRWSYSLNLFTNPAIFFLVWKILFCIFAVMFAVMMIADAANFSDFYPDRLLYNLKFSGYILAGMTAVCGLGYIIYAAVMGGKYIVDFEMDEKGILHSQTPVQAKKAKRLGSAASLFGAARGSLTAAGVGINSQRTEMYSDFSKVRKVKPYPSKRLIKINGRLSRNQVYVYDGDFEFVKNYIISHCDNIKK